MYEDYTRSEVQSMLSSLFDRQYELTFEEVVEVRYRTENRTRTLDSSYTDPVTGEVPLGYGLSVRCVKDDAVR